jgi:N-ethylmaleimide reductase
MTDLFSPLKIGHLTLPNRIVMAPLTRCRADRGHAPHALNATYYAQRAGSGLIVSEATQISQQGQGYPGTPGIYSPQQVAGWRLVTDAVHAAGGHIFAQLWHVGRTSHNAFQSGGAAPVSSSAVARAGECILPDGSKAPYPTPHALGIDEIRAVIADYRHAAACALEAGFDGVELHGANGYLPDQFLRDGVNHRIDEYGGSIPNRARFHLEATQALLDVWGPGRVGVRLSPSGVFGEMRDSNPRATFSHLIEAFNDHPLAYLHVMEAMEGDLKHGPESVPGYEAIPVSFFKAKTRHPVITNAGFNFDKGRQYVREGWADAIAYGTPYIANPDLTERFRLMASGHTDVPLNPPDPATFYYGGQGPMERGYTDYPTLADVRVQTSRRAVAKV